MFGPMYQQMMKARLGVGKPMEGYGGFTPSQGQPQASLPAPSPWMQQGGGPRTTPFQPRPFDGTTPLESPWNPRQTPYQPRPEGGAMGESPWNPRSNPFEDRPQGGETRMGGGGVMGGMKNPWQRY